MVGFCVLLVECKYVLVLVLCFKHTSKHKLQIIETVESQFCCIIRNKIIKFLVFGFSMPPKANLLMITFSSKKCLKISGTNFCILNQLLWHSPNQNLFFKGGVGPVQGKRKSIYNPATFVWSGAFDKARQKNYGRDTKNLVAWANTEPPASKKIPWGGMLGSAVSKLFLFVRCVSREPIVF